MNEPLFKNSFVRDEKTIKEFYKHNYLTATHFKIVYIGYTVLILFSLLTYDISLFAFYLVLGIVMALVFLFSYLQKVKILIARDKETSNGKDLIVEISVFEDRIEHIVNDTEAVIAIDNRFNNDSDCIDIVNFVYCSSLHIGFSVYAVN